jgi:hypothetical protein
LTVDALERLAVPAGSVVGGELGERVIAGAQRVLDGFRGVGGRAGVGPVVGKIAETVPGVVAVEGFEGGGDAQVESLRRVGPRSS